MGERLTRGQAAERFGVTRQRIDELINEGRLTEERATVDADEAAEVFAAMDPAYVARERMSREGSAKPRDPVMQAFNRAKTAEQIAKAKRAELDFSIRSGRFIDREKVKRSGFEAGKVFASKCANFPNRVAPLVANRKDAREVHEILTAEMAALVQEIRDELAGIG